MLGLLIAMIVSDSDFRDLSQDVTIHRDRYGIPHIDSKTDAGAVFGLMFAQAEDNYRQLEEDTAFAIGRASEIVGERGLGNDLRFRAFQIERLAKERLAKADSHFRGIAHAYADGLNFYLAKHPDLKPRIPRYEPWFFLANVDLPGNVDGVSTMRVGDIKSDSDRKGLAAKWPPAEDDGLFFDAGSNAWAIAPSRTTSGRAILFLNPHVGLFGRGQRYECHLRSGEGWDFSGFCILGNPIPHAGFNRNLGWAHTNTSADMADAYRLEVEGDHEYRYGSERRKIEDWEDTLRVREDGELVPYTFRFERSHYGPVVRRGGEAHSVRLPLERWMEFWPQKLAMTKARTLDEFKKALAVGGLTYSNTTYADDQGNVAFWYGNTVPRRDPQFDWTKPVDGSDPRTEWQGYHTPDELPHVINPPSGFVQNCNSNPWGTTEGPGNPDPAKYPSYIVRDPDTARAKNSRRILSGNQKFSYDDLSRLSFDTELFTARLRVPKIVAAVTADSDTAAKYGEPLAALRAWDFRGGVDSVPSTLYIETEMAAGGDGWRVQMNEDPPSLRRAFTQVVDRLEGRWGTWQVPWGKVNRLQRQQPFSKEHPSWPVPGANSSFGQIFAFTGPPQDGVRYGTGGNTYVALVEFGPRPRASAVCGFGQSADPQSPHFLDQAPLYAAGQYRPAWFDWDDVKKNAERSYHPGD